MKKVKECCVLCRVDTWIEWKPGYDGWCKNRKCECHTTSATPVAEVAENTPNSKECPCDCHNPDFKGWIMPITKNYCCTCTKPHTPVAEVGGWTKTKKCPHNGIFPVGCSACWIQITDQARREGEKAGIRAALEALPPEKIHKEFKCGTKYECWCEDQSCPRFTEKYWNSYRTDARTALEWLLTPEDTQI